MKLLLKIRATPKLSKNNREEFMKRLFSIIACFLAVILLFSSCTSDKTPPKTELTKVRFAFTNATPDFVANAWFVAQERGFFEEEGLDVEIQWTGGTSRALQFLVSGQSDIAWASPAGTINAYVAGHDIVAFFAIDYIFPFEITVPANSPITKWDASQFRGTTIGVTEFAGGEMPMLLGALHLLGLKDNVDFTLKEIGGGEPLTLSELQSGKVQAYATDILSAGKIEIAGVPLRRVQPEGVRQFPGNTFVAMRDYYTEHRDVCIGMVRAVAKAEYWMQANIIGAVDICAKYAPDVVAEGGVDGTRYILEEFSVKGLEAKPTGISYGWQLAEPWIQYQQFLLASGSPDPEDPIQFTDVIDPSLILDNSMIEEVNAGIDKAAVVKDAQAYQLQVINKPPYNYKP